MRIGIEWHERPGTTAPVGDLRRMSALPPDILSDPGWIPWMLDLVVRNHQIRDLGRGRV